MELINNLCFYIGMKQFFKDLYDAFNFKEIMKAFFIAIAVLLFLILFGFIAIMMTHKG